MKEIVTNARTGESVTRDLTGDKLAAELAKQAESEAKAADKAAKVGKIEKALGMTIAEIKEALE